MLTSTTDAQRLREALALAETAIGISDPNPRVGCVIAAADGRVVGTGATQMAGGAHAEVMALRDAQAGGRSTQGATVWVTLEPCAHFGRTPPCCDALIAAGVARVVVATPDPFAQVAGAGLTRMRDAGIDVVVANGNLAMAARELNVGYFSRIERKRPWVRVKTAISLDGRTALPDGRSKWITGEAARLDGQHWRRRAGAILTGIGTVLADDPRLDVRLPGAQLQPLRVVLDSRLRTPATAQLFARPGPVLLVCATANAQREQALRAAGADVQTLGRDGRIDLPALMTELARREINELHVEAGATLAGALLDADLVDEILIYQAPIVLGAGRGLAELGTLATLAAAPAFQFVDVSRIGDDLRLRARRRAPAAP